LISLVSSARILFEPCKPIASIKGPLSRAREYRAAKRGHRAALRSHRRTAPAAGATSGETAASSRCATPPPPPAAAPPPLPPPEPPPPLSASAKVGSVALNFRHLHLSLISYSADHVGHFQRAATFVDKILKGANPAELPVEQPTKFELVINLKTAEASNSKFHRR